MKGLFLLLTILLLSGCGLKYESYVEGNAPKPEQVQAAVNDLIDVFNRSDLTADAVTIYPAEGDRIMRPLLERRLRRFGYAVSPSQPVSVLSAAKKEKVDANTVPIRYRASFIDGIGTFCLVITGERKMLCRMYNSEGEPVSSITHRGFRIERDEGYRPTDLKLEQPSEKRVETRASAEQVDPYDPLQQHKPFRPVSPGKADTGSDTTTSEDSIAPVNAPRYRPLPTDLLRENLEKFVAALPEDAQIAIATDRLKGESDTEYRYRLLQYMDDANQYIRTGVVSRESTLRVSAND